MATNNAIRDYARAQGWNPNAAGAWEVKDDAMAGSIYDHAKEQGYTSNELDSAFGWDSGTAANWMTKNNRAVLGAATPASSPTSTPGNTPRPPAGPGPSPTPAARSGFDWTAAPRVSGGGANSDMLSGWYADYMKSRPNATGPVQAQTTRWEVDPNQTAQGQLRGMLDKGGALMQSAALRGRQNAARSGMLNSTMGIEAAQKAMIDSASPIALADAEMYGRAGEFNAGESNETSRFNTGQTNDWNTRDIDRRVEGAQFGAKLSEDARQANLSADTQLTTAGMNYDLGDRRLRQEGTQFAEDQTFRAGQNALDRQQQTGERLGAQVFEAGQANVDRSWRSNEANADRGWRTAEGLNERDFEAQTIAQRHLNDLERLGIESNLSNAKIGPAAAASIGGNLMSYVNAIMADPDLTPESKQAAIGNQVTFANTLVDFLESLYGTEMPDFNEPA